jgi:hypothetical protein
VSVGQSRQIGAVTRVIKQISEADVALFELVTKDDQLEAEEPPSPSRQPRKPVPFPFVASLLASAAARHHPQPDLARCERQIVTFLAPAYTDDTLSATAEVAAHDSATGILRVRAYCDNQEGERLAEGEFHLRET